MQKPVIVVHGGAGKLSPYLKQHDAESKEGIRLALETGYQLLKKGKSALAAVEAAVMILEDNPFFNAGRGSVLNQDGEVEMDAAIMDGNKLKAGAVAIIRNVKNPIVLARLVMTKTKHVLLSGAGAQKFAQQQKIIMKPENYFITEYELQSFKTYKKLSKKKLHGTVGAVAIDKKGNLASATSTGGISHSLPGRVGDSCIIGAGCYANNKTCAVSGTGEGELFITRVIAHTISSLLEFKKMSIQDACDEVIHERSHHPKGEMGVITLDNKGRIGIAFNTQTMRRGFIDTHGKMKILIDAE